MPKNYLILDRHKSVMYVCVQPSSLNNFRKLPQQKQMLSEDLLQTQGRTHHQVWRKYPELDLARLVILFQYFHFQLLFLYSFIFLLSLLFFKTSILNLWYNLFTHPPHVTSKILVFIFYFKIDFLNFYIFIFLWS